MTGPVATAGPRPVRAPRGTELSCRGWPQEAALRMLMNNLDPEVAEDPDHLVVYGGTGRAARRWDAFDAIVRELRRLADDETLLVQSGKPVGGLPDPSVGAAGAHRELEPGRQVGQLGRTSASSSGPGLTMYGQMTAGLLDLHRHPGHPAGHVRDVRGAGAAALRRDAPRTGHADRGSRRHGRRAAAGRDHERWRGLAIEVDPARAHAGLDIGYVDRLTR